MDKSFLQLEYSGWWILLLAIVAASLSYLLYTKKDVPWTKTENWILAIIRFFGIFSLTLLLLTPSMRLVRNTIEKPMVAIALDNSQSVAYRGDSKDSLTTIIQSLSDDLVDIGFETSTITFNDSTTFSAHSSNLSQLLDKVKEESEDQHLVNILLATDGIYNRGISPLFKSYLNPISTLGLGDTIPPRDISISRTLYNKITYKDNETPIRLEVSQQGFNGQEVTIQLHEQGVLLAKRKVRLNQEIQEVEFIVKSGEEGLRHLIASIPPNTEESTYENNKSNVFMEVIDGRKKVLILANAPHPDIKAIRSTLNETGNYQVEIYIPKIHDERPNDIFDVVVFHGAFTSGFNFSLKERPGIWYIMSDKSSITSINKTLPYINIQRQGSRPDRVAGSFNQNFSKFKIEDVSIFEEYPPVEVPFGTYSLSGPTEVLMYQKLGNIITDKPLMAIYDNGSEKNALLLGQNIWQWKLQEAAINGNTNQFDNLITKTIQFLSLKNNKEQFQFNIRKRNITDSELALFDAEVYNDIYERIYNNPISITITAEDGGSQNYSFTDSEFNSTFRSPSLSPGIYKFSASVTIGNKSFTDQGEFSVQDINPEYLNLTANHQLLKNLSVKTGGEYYHINNRNSLLEYYRNQDFKSKIKSEERFIPLYKAWWWYLIIFLLFSFEWMLRKYWGGY